MALPNPYEVEIPSDSEDEDEYIEAVWVEEPAECPVQLLIITNGVFPKKAMEAAVNQTIVTRSPYSKLREKSLMRDMTFEKITTSDEKFVWAHVEKPFTKKAAVLVGQKIAEMGFEKIDIIEAEACQLALQPPGLYKLGECEGLDIPDLPVGCAAQDLAGFLLTKSILGKIKTKVRGLILFTEYLRSPQIEDLLLYDAILPQSIQTKSRFENLSKFTTADRLKDNIYV
ncbi:unnamed protein product [Oikopleura dioica]|uniref:Proteasome assembly chaperone 1 n=1 Tax=Oikopleura dioica TaxID=34765 RepID=E4WZN3_OIKDI|nr:unnamed protein product [Oikopleura dioica]